MEHISIYPVKFVIAGFNKWMCAHFNYGKYTFQLK